MGVAGLDSCVILLLFLQRPLILRSGLHHPGQPRHLQHLHLLRLLLQGAGQDSQHQDQDRQTVFDLLKNKDDTSICQTWSKPPVLRIIENIAFITTCKAADTNTFGIIFGKKGYSDMAAIAIALLAILNFVLLIGARGVAQYSTAPRSCRVPPPSPELCHPLPPQVPQQVPPG